MMKTWKKIALALSAVLVVACNHDDNILPVKPKKPDTPNPPTQSILPKKELRGVWMATVWGLDWPRGEYNAESQKASYIAYMKALEKNNINAVFVQVRGRADAFYKSDYEPWCQYLTGEVDKDPGYDVLRFMIDEAHKRGIAFHAWFNPYRVATKKATDAAFPALDSRIPQAMMVDYKTIRMYNPALPEVRQRIFDIIKDLISKYDVDGVHIDDYFYPSLTAGETIKDEEEYKKYAPKDNNGKPTITIEEFRRNNVDLAVKGIHDVVQATRPEVVFTVSPAGDPDYNYNTMYADVVKWSREGWTEAIIPQLYFPMGNAATNFNQRLIWWSQYTFKNALFIGYGTYKFGDPKYPAAYQNASELAKQFAFASKYNKVTGSVLYSAKDLLNNPVDILSVIKDVYKQPAVLPYLGKQTATPPSTPTNVRANGKTLQWNGPDGAYFAVYRDNGVGKEATTIAVTRQQEVTLTEAGTYFVTAVSKKDNAESQPTTPVKVN